MRPAISPKKMSVGYCRQWAVLIRSRPETIARGSSYSEVGFDVETRLGAWFGGPWLRVESFAAIVQTLALQRIDYQPAETLIIFGSPISRASGRCTRGKRPDTKGVSSTGFDPSVLVKLFLCLSFTDVNTLKNSSSFFLA